jgi:hypothetical protein
MYLKKITLFSISIVMVSGILILLISYTTYVPTKLSHQFSENLQGYEWQNVQLHEDCFNGIDDDGDGLIDQKDEFDC